MKTYVLMIAKTFPAKHLKAGQLTNFGWKIEFNQKIHTIRANYHFWHKKIDNVNEGKAIISLRQWSGKPYQSKQIELRQFSKGQINYQLLLFGYQDIDRPIIDVTKRKTLAEISFNDGLNTYDFKDWFKNYDLDEPFAIIHFTNFKY